LFVSPRGPAFLVASIGIGALLVALAAMHAAAQTAPGSLPGMRSTIDGEADTASGLRRPKKQTKSVNPTPVGQLPTFALPPARGAGETGFDSTNTRRKTKARPVAGVLRTEAATAPTQLLPSEALRSGQKSDKKSDKKAGQSSSSDKAKKAAPADKKQRAQAPARPSPPGTAPAQLSRAQLLQVREQANGQPPIPVALLRKRLVADEDPYDQLGIRAGAFLLRPAIETTTGYDTNPARVSNGRGSAFVIVAPELAARSDWQRHELNADIRGSYTAYEATPEENRPFLDARMGGRVDVTDRTRIELGARYLVSTDNPGSPNIQAGVAELPLFTTIGGTAGVAHRFNRFELAVRGSAERTEYDDSVLTDGTIVSNAGRNYNQYGAQMRASYELNPGLKPFAQVDVDTRVYDLPIDAGGVPRDSDGVAGRVGAVFEMPRFLTGEVSIGYLTRVYKDPDLPNLEGLLFDASLIWTATALTTVKLNAKTSAGESTLAGVSGVFTRDIGLQVDHAFRRWLIGSARIGYGLDDYVGSIREDSRYTAGAALTYKLTRSWQVKGEFRQEWLKSNVPGNDYTASIAMIGLRWQP
jgi:hypothetical protein